MTRVLALVSPGHRVLRWSLVPVAVLLMAMAILASPQTAAADDHITVTKTLLNPGDPVSPDSSNWPRVSWRIDVKNDAEEPVDLYMIHRVGTQPAIAELAQGWITFGVPSDPCGRSGTDSQGDDWITYSCPNLPGESERYFDITFGVLPACESYVTLESTLEVYLGTYDNYDADNPIFVLVEEELAEVIVPPEPELCPIVTKEGMEGGTPGGLFTWTITVELPEQDAFEGTTNERSVRLTDPDVTLTPGDHGCAQIGDDIFCELEEGESTTFQVTRSSGAATCEGASATNTITALGLSSWLPWFNPVPPLDELLFEPLTVPAALQDVIATVSGSPAACDDDDTSSPPPPASTPTPTDDPPATVEGCSSPEVPHATWAPTPAVPGNTIAIWGGGNVDDFPAPLATSYWTTVNGLWVGYIPGAPDFVNAAFFAQFPDGDVPACTPFVVHHR